MLGISVISTSALDYSDKPRVTKVILITQKADSQSIRSKSDSPDFELSVIISKLVCNQPALSDANYKGG